MFVIDLFCGAGGETTGIESAKLNGRKCAKVVACVNHDANAIASHAANHANTLHYTEDIRTLETSGLKQVCETIRQFHSKSVIQLHASLECTNFSKAKGGMPRDADSRTLAEHLFRYIEAISPDFVQIENVEEFMCWGDLDENGKPVSRDKGKKYLLWVKNVCAYGYDYDWKILNAADYGAYTTRKRFFGQFAKKGLPIAFPKPTHAKSKGGDNELFHDDRQQWKAVRDVLDLDDDGESIFTRKKPLVEKTLERIYAGLIKFVAGGNDAFLVKWNSVNGKTGKYVAPGIDEPSPTVACQNRLGIAKAHFLSKQFGGDPAGKNISVEEPAGTLPTIDHHALVDTEFLTAYFGNGFNSSIEDPAPTLKCKEHLGLVTSEFLVNEYSGGGQTSSIDKPCPSILTIPKQKIVGVKPWIMDTGYNNVGSSIDEPSHTITANRKWHYLMNPYSFKSDGCSIDKPCFTLIARMDKMPPYLISTDKGLAIEVYKTDSPMTVSIKEFMALYGIADIRMRMLNVRELKRIMGFPEDYTLIGTQSEQKKFIGNAVEVNMSRVLCEALCKRLYDKNQKE